MNDFSAFRTAAAIALVTVSCALFSTLPGCGHKPLPEGPVHAQVAAVPATGFTQAQRLAGEAEVVCADERRCPENVGMIVAVTESGVDRCTGALIGPDLVLTASRCVPPETRGEASCGARVHFLLPTLSGGVPAQQARCARVLESEAGAAYAFIRLEAPLSGRHPLELSFGGLADGAAFTVPVINPTSDTRVLGEVRVLKCKAFQKTAVFPQFRGDLSPLAALGGCHAGVTALGAPVLDDHGVARAAIQAGLAPEALQEFQQAYGPLLRGAQVVDFSFAASLACIRIPGAADRPLPAACAADAQFKVADAVLAGAITPDLLALAQAELDEHLLRKQGTPGQKLRWTALPLTAVPAQNSQLSPLCIAGSDQWLGNYHHWYTPGGYVSATQVDLAMPRFQVSFSLNPALQARVEIQNLAPSWVTMSFSPRQLAQTGQSTVTLREGTRGTPVGSPMSLPKCVR